MTDMLRDLILNGFMIFPSNGKFIVKKQAVPDSNFSIAEQECASYAEAVEYAAAVFNKPRISVWQVTVRYNRGLGIEYKNLQDVCAVNHEEAMDIAKTQAELMLKGNKTVISEIKLRPKN